MTPPSSTEYKAPQLLGDEQSRLTRMEAMTAGVKEIMSELRDDMKSINRRLGTMEQSRAVAEVQALQNAKDIIALQTDLKAACKDIAELKSECKEIAALKEACKPIGEIQTQLRAYKLTGNIMKAFIGVLLAGVIWLIRTTIETERVSGNNAAAIINLKDSTSNLNTSDRDMQNQINDLKIKKTGESP